MTHFEIAKQFIEENREMLKSMQHGKPEDPTKLVVDAFGAGRLFERVRVLEAISRAKPIGGRAWTSEQLAVFSALTHVADFIEGQS